MKLPRRRLLQLAAGAAGAAAVPALPRPAAALDYPTRQVRLLIGFGPGGAPDILARLISQWLSQRLGQTFVVENRPGANGDIAKEDVVRASPDGYTLLLLLLSDAVNATLYPSTNYNFTRDLAPVAGLSRDPDVMVVNPDFPAKTVAEFIAYAKAHPGTINFASAGVGTSLHMAGELFKYMTKVEMTHVAYRSSALAMSDLLAKQVQVCFAPISSSIAYIKAGKLRPLGVTTATRSAALPDVPPISDTVPGYEMSAWYGIGAPKNTPAEIIDKLNKEINAGLADPGVTGKMAALGSTPYVISPAGFSKFIADETDKWAKVIKAAGIKAD